MVNNTGPCLERLLALAMLLIVIIFTMALMAGTKAADLPIQPDRPESNDLNRFGRYSDAYYQRRWKRMCKGGGRYVAMSEAYDGRKPDPCQPGAKEWRR